MTHKKIEIDLDELEREISTFDKEIERAELKITEATKERSIKVQLRDYILANYGGTHKKSSLNGTKLIKPAKRNQPNPVGQPTGISDFVRDIIKNNPGIHTAKIGEGYAKHLNVRYDNSMQKTISRCLSRLKKGGFIENELREGGKRAGSDWKVTKKSLNYN